MVLEDVFFCSFSFLPIHPYFYPAIFVFTRPNDGWTGLYIKLCGPVLLNLNTCWQYDIVDTESLVTDDVDYVEYPSSCCMKVHVYPV